MPGSETYLTKWLNAFALVLAAVAVGLVGFKNYRGEKEGQLLNVSYDPTREVYQEINPKFIAKYEAEAGYRVSIEQSHGGGHLTVSQASHSRNAPSYGPEESHALDRF